MKKKNKQYGEEFKQDVVNYYYSSGTSMKAVADDLKISQSSLHNWIKSAKSNEGHRHTQQKLTEAIYIELDKARKKRRNSVNSVSKYLGVSTSGFYSYVNRVESKRARSCNSRENSWELHA